MPLPRPHASDGEPLIRARLALAVLLLGLATCAAPTFGFGVPFATVTGARKAGSSTSEFDRAQRMREFLEARPEGQRSRPEYDRVLEAFRAIYHARPADPHADASVNAVAALLAEQGRLFQDAKASRDAIGQYEFLRREYPASRLRYAALLGEGAIYSHALGERAAARDSFLEFLKLYPRNPLASQARQELRTLGAPSALEQGRPTRQGPGEASATGNAGVHQRHNAVLEAALASQAEQSSHDARASSMGSSRGAGSPPGLSADAVQAPDRNAGSSSPAPAVTTGGQFVAGTRSAPAPMADTISSPRTGAPRKPGRASRDTLVEHDLPSPGGPDDAPAQGASSTGLASPGNPYSSAITKAQMPALDNQPAPRTGTAATASTVPRSSAGRGFGSGPGTSMGDAARPGDATRVGSTRRPGRLPLITGVRHWSTSVYTRVAIDLQDEVQYEASRVPDPDRIFFDLHGARLSPELIGKAVMVTDGGFLRRIRAAQFSNDVVRVVLDVSDVSEYSAFFLPNPSRLIIDIHGKTPSPGGGQSLVAGNGAPDVTATPLRLFAGEGNVAGARQRALTSEPGHATGSASAGSAAAGTADQQLADDEGLARQPRPPVPITRTPPVAVSRTSAQGSARSSSPGPAPAPSGAGYGRSSYGEVSGPSASPSGSPTASSASRPATGAGTAPGPAPSANTLGDIATLDRQPNVVRATRTPTTAPVSASVADTTPARQPGSVLAPAPDLTTRRTHPASNAAASVAPVTRARGMTREDTPAPASHAPEVGNEGPDDDRGGSQNVVQGGARSRARTPAGRGAEFRAAAPTATGDRSMVRALGLKIGRIVVDAGHGGHDSGTLGPGGIEEKDVVLDVALRLGRLLKQRLGADVIYTRDDDTFIPLETRTAIANKAQADLFISVHANSSQDASARGVETYYLNFTTSADALEVAARENAVSDQSIHQLSDLVKKITLQDKISESREFAGDVEQSLYTGLEAGNAGLKDRGVKKAPFVVLIGANMPSILAEISFLTNPDDAHQLRDGEYRQRIAESLYRGVAKYIGSLSGVRLAESGTHPGEQ